MTSPTRSNAADALLTQLRLGPSFREIAAMLLRQSLRDLYPTLAIDPDITLVCTPAWHIVDDQILPATAHYQALTDVLAIQAVLAVPSVFIESEHFLTQQPITVPAVHLPVRISEVGNLINLLAPVMLSAYQEQQLAFWNTRNGMAPQWQMLSTCLRNMWDVTTAPNWKGTDLDMARQLFNNPDRLNRTGDPFACKACLIDIGQGVEADNSSLKVLPIAVLAGTHETRTIILTYSLLHGYERFDSLAELGKALPRYVIASGSDAPLQWRLFEPDGNFFDQQACALIAIQIEAIGAIDFSAMRQGDANGVTLSSPPAVETLTPSNGPDIQWYQDALPEWLKSASSSDMALYSRHLKELAALHSTNAGASYQEGIAPLREYTLDALRTQMIAQHADAAALTLGDLEIRVQSQVVWGLFTVPGKIETATFSLVDLALQNLIALPLGNKSLVLHNARSVPEWLSTDYVESLVSQVDIGRQYPLLIKQKLLDDPQESARRQALYSQHLRIQLPLLALQYKILGQSGIDERGYRYVAALMEPLDADRQVDGQPIVLRPLAFLPLRRDGGAADEVANMYVIGPQDPSTGPCLLYRPLFEPPLIQYPSPTNLLYAITQDLDLRDAVLAWLPEAVRNDYANYTFPGQLPSPWAVVRFLVDPAKLLIMSGPMSLGGTPLNGDLLASLFKANANALVELADRQSVSNAENRWATFKHAGWLALNAALPFLGSTAGAAAWVWQVMDQLQQVVDAQQRPKDQERWAALVELLMNLGMAITLHAVRRTQPARRRLPASSAEKPVSAAPVALDVKQLKDISGPELPHDHPQSLYTGGAITLTASSLAKRLDSIKVSKPQGLGSQNTATGAYTHLYPLGPKWYAPVGPRWFEVTVDEGDTVVIIDPKQPGHNGPPLINNAKGEWFIDTRLRLRGGGPKLKTKKAKDVASLKALEVRAKLEKFEREKTAAQTHLQQVQKAMADAPSTSAQATHRRLYLATLENQRQDYETALTQLNTLNVFAPVTNYQQQALGYLKVQLDLTQAGITEALTTFTPKLRTVLNQIETQAESPQQRHIADAWQMSEMNRDMIARLDYVQSRFSRLQGLAKEGLQLIQNTKRLMPAYTREDLNALQVSLARNLCLSEKSTASAPDAWVAIDRIVDTAEIAVQGLRDTLGERSEARLDERIETLNSLIEQFKTLDERLQDFPEDFPEQAQDQPIARLREQIGIYARRALIELGMLHTDRETLRSRPTPPPTPPRPRKKFINTRYNGVLIGEPRLTSAGLETDLVDIRSPLTQQVMATFHEKQPGQWVQQIKPSATPAPALDLPASIDAGQALLDGLPAFNQRASTQISEATRTASGIEYMLHQHAMSLERADDAIEHALTQSNATESETRSAATVGKQLSTAVKKLYEEASSYRLRTIKQRPPTVEGIEWLKSKNEISIKKTVNRQRNGPTDYLDVYTISERSTHMLLWYAHFHYSAAWTMAKSFVSARLKTPEEVRQGADANHIPSLSDQQKIDFYRSEISLEQARRVFFGAQ
ncbi:DUF6543 domain-containing protein [uncultured Pseudomonas sp.]|uniref:DUF6543 domain-containing protein n=1 Tax=uncultured Pseudomonas sp. TaxID=114707 RepID=UPI0025E232DE|nr:DUF6543 domain-containing protein [uncultured Pseudomonas sp.]